MDVLKCVRKNATRSQCCFSTHTHTHTLMDSLGCCYCYVFVPTIVAMTATTLLFYFTLRAQLLPRGTVYIFQCLPTQKNANNKITTKTHTRLRHIGGLCLLRLLAALHCGAILLVCPPHSLYYPYVIIFCLFHGHMVPSLPLACTYYNMFYLHVCVLIFYNNILLFFVRFCVW